MSQNRFDDADWDGLHTEIQNRLKPLADEVARVAPSIRPRFSKTVTEHMPLFSYVSFRRPAAKEPEFVIVGVNVIPLEGQWRINVDISDEEDGTMYLNLSSESYASVRSMRCENEFWQKRMN